VAKAWREKNPARVLAQRTEYGKKYPERVVDQAAVSYRKHRSERLASSKVWAEKNRDKVRAQKRKSAARPEAKKLMASWLAANKQKILALKRKWAADNLPLARARRAKYVAARRQRVPAWDVEMTDFVMLEAADLCQRREATTGVKWEVDHQVPLRGKAVSGLHVWNNLRVIPREVNRSKGNKFEI
jgi:hypothetical protein